MKKREDFNRSKKPVRLLAFLFLIYFIVQSCDTQLDNEIAQSAHEKSERAQTSDVLNRADNTVGFQGTVYNTYPQTIPNAVLTFSRADIHNVVTITCDGFGAYRIALAPASYYVSATANGYLSALGFFVVTGVDGYQTGTFFLDEATGAGFRGTVFNINDVSVTIPNARITFTSQYNPSIIYTVYSDAAGNYEVNLFAESYYARAEANGYAVYDTTPGLLVVNGTSYQTGNFFLTPSKTKKLKKPKKHPWQQ